MPSLDLHPIGILAILLGLLFAGLLTLFSWSSRREREPVAARRAGWIAAVILLVYFAAGFGSAIGPLWPAFVLLCLTGLGLLALLAPIGGAPPIESEIPRSRIDERTIMFSRRRLEPGMERFEEYYREHPNHRDSDDRFRALPGLMSAGSSHYEPRQFAAAEATFTSVEQFWPIVEKPAREKKTDLDSTTSTLFLHRWAKKLGATSVGVTELKDYHLYSHVGRGPDFGKPIEQEHTFAIAFTVEMDKEMVDYAPLGPTLMESAQQYLSAGAIAVQIAEWIRNLGYPARAHIDGNYRVVCPLVARDAGLGEIGRMGLLMTPTLGPRVRLGVVTTDLPLLPGNRRSDPSVIDFCSRCRKCAIACPSQAIPFGDRTTIDETRRWRIDSEACFTFWCAVGTDCARCMRVCPYSHPESLFHKAVRWGIRRSVLFRNVALRLDDLFYGRVPETADLPDWLRKS